MLPRLPRLTWGRLLGDTMNYLREITKLIEFGMCGDRVRVEAYARQLLRKAQEGKDPDAQRLYDAMFSDTPGWDMGVDHQLPGRPALMNPETPNAVLSGNGERKGTL